MNSLEKFKLRYKTYGREYYLKHREETIRRSNQRYKENKLKIRAQRKAFYNNPENYTRFILDRCRQRARKKGVPFNLTLSDLVIPKVCPVFGYPLIINRGGKQHTYNSPSIDRVVPSLGYVRGNIQIISYKANTMKNDASKSELLMFADWIKRENGQTSTNDTKRS